MNSKFELGTIVFDNGGFLEYMDVAEMVFHQGIETLPHVVGYFPPTSNVTYTELNQLNEESAWTIAVIDIDGIMQLHFVGSTVELKSRIQEFMKKGETPEYVTLYRNQSLKFWNVPDEEFKDLSDKWERGSLTDADFTERLHDIEERMIVSNGGHKQ